MSRRHSVLGAHPSRKNDLSITGYTWVNTWRNKLRHSIAHSVVHIPVQCQCHHLYHCRLLLWFWCPGLLMPTLITNNKAVLPPGENPDLYFGQYFILTVLYICFFLLVTMSSANILSYCCVPISVWTVVCFVSNSLCRRVHNLTIHTATFHICFYLFLIYEEVNMRRAPCTSFYALSWIFTFCLE